MISSAVVIPDPQPEAESPSPTLKRRQSSASSDSNKRPRLENQRAVAGSVNHGSPPPADHAMPPPLSRRKSSTTGASALEEKKRGQRLFGALLGTLSQTSAKPAHRRREEIEKRQQERLRRDQEEREDERKRKREQLDKTRRIEQKAWDEEGMKIRHQNLRSMAGFLRTKTEPHLYYKPWELREEEEEQIKRQIEEAEETIQRELAEQAAKRGEETGTNDDLMEAAAAQSVEQEASSSPQRHMDTNGNDAADKSGTNEVRKDDTTEPVQDETSDSPGGNDESRGKTPKHEERPKDDDHGGEELVEGQEDDVIY